MTVWPFSTPTVVPATVKPVAASAMLTALLPLAVIAITGGVSSTRIACVACTAALPAASETSAVTL